MRLLSWFWRGWLKFAEIFGTIQMMVLLSALYFTFLGLMALPSRLISDPLGSKRRPQTNWVKRPPITDPLEYMRRQG
jgi:hypothetical protein